mgnify:CR=1 FL=1
MPAPDNAVRVAGEWVEKAEHDLDAATHLLTLGEDGPTDVACFHAQQCVEKYLKALLVLHGRPVPRTHDVAKIVALAAIGHPIDITPDEMHTLTEYATEARYPGSAPVSLEEAEEAVLLAGRVREQVRRLFPPEALVRRRK